MQVDCIYCNVNVVGVATVVIILGVRFINSETQLNYHSY